MDGYPFFPEEYLLHLIDVTLSCDVSRHSCASQSFDEHLRAIEANQTLLKAVHDLVVWSHVSRSEVGHRFVATLLHGNVVGIAERLHILLLDLTHHTSSKLLLVILRQLFLL